MSAPGGMLARRAMLLLAVAACIGGCGQKGPLYLPDSAGSVVTRPTQTPPPANTPGANAAPAGADAADKPDGKSATKPATPKTPER